MSHSYVRRLRTRFALSQEELADLLDLTKHRICRFESGEDLPPIAALLGLQVVFGRAPRSLFPAAYYIIEERVMGRAAILERTLADKHDPISAKKRQLLAAMMHRASHGDGA